MISRTHQIEDTKTASVGQKLQQDNVPDRVRFDWSDLICPPHPERPKQQLEPDLQSWIFAQSSLIGRNSIRTQSNVMCKEVNSSRYKGYKGRLLVFFLRLTHSLAKGGVFQVPETMDRRRTGATKTAVRKEAPGTPRKASRRGLKPTRTHAVMLSFLLLRE